MYEAELDNVFEEPLLLSQCAASAVAEAASRAVAGQAAALVEMMSLRSSPSPSPSPSPSSPDSSVLSWPAKETLTWAKAAAGQLSRVCRFIEEDGGGDGGGEGGERGGSAAFSLPRLLLLRSLERLAPGGVATAAAVFLPAAKAAAALVGAAAVVYQEEEEEEEEGEEEQEERRLLEEVRSLVEAAARSLLSCSSSSSSSSSSPHAALYAAVAGAARAWNVGKRSASAGEVVEALVGKARGRAEGGALFLVN